VTVIDTCAALNHVAAENSSKQILVFT